MLPIGAIYPGAEPLNNQIILTSLGLLNALQRLDLSCLPGALARGLMSNTVVVVDDDAAMNKALCRLLQAGGFDTVSFTCAESLLADNAADDAWCFVVDLQLPGVSGLKLAQILRGKGLKTPIVFITAHAEGNIWNDAQTMGCLACFAKPFSGRDLLDLLISISVDT